MMLIEEKASPESRIWSFIEACSNIVMIVMQNKIRANICNPQPKLMRGLKSILILAVLNNSAKAMAANMMIKKYMVSIEKSGLSGRK